MEKTSASTSSKFIIPRIIVGLGLPIVILSGIETGLEDSLVVRYGEAVFIVAVLILASLGIPRVPNGTGILIVTTGLLIAASNDLLNLIYGYDWFEGHWHFTPDWIKLITYTVLAYILARKRNIFLIVIVIGIVALLDTILEWTSSLTTQFIRVVTAEGESIHRLHDYSWNDLPELFIGFVWDSLKWAAVSLAAIAVIKLVRSRLHHRASVASSQS